MDLAYHGEMTRVLYVLLALAVSVVAAPAQPRGASSDPCALVTVAEVQKAVGHPFGASKRNATNPSVCDYTAGNVGAVVNVMLVDKAPGDSAEKTVAELKKRKIAAETVAGIGDGAYSSDPGYGMRQLGAYKGSKHVIVTLMIPGATVAQAKAAAGELIRKALARL